MDRTKRDRADGKIKIKCAENRAMDAGAGPHHTPPALARGNVAEAGAEDYLSLMGHFSDLIGRKAKIEKPVCGSQRGKQRCCRETETGAYGKPADCFDRDGNTESVKCRTDGGRCAGNFP
jgi:hypothetical protein